MKQALVRACWVICVQISWAVATDQSRYTMLCFALSTMRVGFLCLVFSKELVGSSGMTKVIIIQRRMPDREQCEHSLTSSVNESARNPLFHTTWIREMMINFGYHLNDGNSLWDSKPLWQVAWLQRFTYPSELLWDYLTVLLLFLTIKIG